MNLMNENALLVKENNTLKNLVLENLTKLKF